jgi:Caspase domain
MRCASVCVGIVDYIDAYYRQSELHLRYAASDAKAFARYTKAISDEASDDREMHHLLVDREATTDNLDAAFASIVKLKRLELFLLYLSGHGERGDPSGGWFCLANAELGRPSLNGLKIRSLLDTISAEYIVVLIDCCHAEAIATGIGLPISLRDCKGRLMIASARADQRSWEDDALQRSLFSDVILRGLSLGSPIADLSGSVDVETKLLPYLREQVPLEAAARKGGQAQEPVSGGWMAQPLKLPTVEARSLGRRLTTVETIRTGIRRSLFGLAITMVASLFVLDALAFHLAVTTTGQLVVRPGLSSTFGLMPFHLSSPVDTGINISDLDPANAEVFRGLAEGAIRGIQTHLDEHGLRTWLAEVKPALRVSIQKSVSAFALGETAQFQPDNEAPPVQELFFLAKLENKPVADMARKLYPNARQVSIDCTANVGATVDFDILNASGEVFARDIRWSALTASSDAKQRAERTAEMVRLAAYRAAHHSDKDADATVLEFLAFADGVVALGKASIATEDLRSSISATFETSQLTWCGLHAALARAILGEAADSEAAEGEFRHMLAVRDPVPGALPTASESIAAEALGRLASFRALGPSTLDTLASLIEQDDDLASTTPAHTLLDRVAEAQPLSERLRDRLLQVVRSAHEEFDFNYVVAIRLLASNIRFLPKDQQDEIADWLRLHSEENRTMSDVHEALGLASASRPLSADELHILEAQLPLVSLFALPKSNYRGDLVIRAGVERAAVALGRVAQTATLPRDTLQRLSNLAQARTDLIGRGEILKGLAANWYRSTIDIPAAIIDQLQSAQASEDRRQFTIDVAAAHLRSITVDRRQLALTAIATRWHEETKPELRIALARLISSALTPQ